MSGVRMAAERSVWVFHGKFPCLVVEIHCFGIRMRSVALSSVKEWLGHLL